MVKVKPGNEQRCSRNAVSQNPETLGGWFEISFEFHLPCPLYGFADLCLLADFVCLPSFRFDFGCHFTISLLFAILEKFVNADAG
jgi:hypothetical protein